MLSITTSLTAHWREFRTRVIDRKFVQDVGLLTIANVAGAALNFSQGIFVARWLGPQLYGAAALVMSYISIVYSFVDVRSSEAMVKYLSEFHASGKQAQALAICKLGYAVDLTAACLMFLLLAMTAQFAARSIVHDPDASTLILIYGVALIPRSFMNTSNAVLVTLGRYGWIATIETTITVFRLVAVIGLLLAGWQVAGVIWANTLAAALSGLAYAAFAGILIQRAWGGSIFQARFQTIKDRQREIARFLAYSDLTAAVGIIPRHLDSVLLGYFRGSTEVGYYKLAKSLSGVAGYLLGPLQAVTYPELARLWALGYNQALSQKVRRLALWVGLPSAFAIVLGAGIAPFALPWLAGEPYIPAVQATQLLFVAAALSLAFFWLRPLYLAKNLVRAWFVINAGLTVSFAAIYPFVLIRWGYLGASAWMLMLYVAGIGVACFWCRRLAQEQ